MRNCRRCRVEKPLTAFTTRGHKRPGQRSTMCLACFAIYRKEPHGTRAQSTPAPAGHKTCGACRVVKPLEAFSPSKQERDGRHSYCRPCLNDKYRGRYPKRDAARRQRHKAELKAGTRVWPSLDPERQRLRRRESEGRRRAAKRSTAMSRLDLKEIYVRDGGRCWICWLTVPFGLSHFDHVIPLARGGSHTADNVRVACAACNVRKHAKLPTPQLVSRIAREVRALVTA